MQLREVNERSVLISVAESNFLDVRARSHTLQAVAQYGGGLTTVTGASEPVRAVTVSVSADFFNVLGVKPLMGRAFYARREQTWRRAGRSRQLWQRLLGGRSDLTGTSLRITDQNVAVIGVMPPDFAFPETQRSGSRASYTLHRSRAQHTTGV